MALDGVYAGLVKKQAKKESKHAEDTQISDSEGRWLRASRVTSPPHRV